MALLDFLKVSIISFSLLKSFCSCSFCILSVEISMSLTFNSWCAFIIWLRVSSYMLETLASSIDFSSNLLARFLLSSSIIAFSSMALFFYLVTSQSIMACDSCSILRDLISSACALFFSIKSTIAASKSFVSPLANTFEVSISLYCLSFSIMAISLLLFRDFLNSSLASSRECRMRCISISWFSMIFPSF